MKLFKKERALIFAMFRKKRPYKEYRLTLKESFGFTMFMLKSGLGLVGKTSKESRILGDLFIDSVTVLAKKNKPGKFFRIREEIRNGKINWITEEKRLAAIDFIAAEMAGRKLGQEEMEVLERRLSKSDIQALRNLIKLY